MKTDNAIFQSIGNKKLDKECQEQIHNKCS